MLNIKGNICKKEYEKACRREYPDLSHKKMMKWYNDFRVFKTFIPKFDRKRRKSDFSYFLMTECYKWKFVGIAYSVDKKYRNCGLASKGLLQLIKFLKNTKKFKAIYAYIMYDNKYREYSEKVLLKNGFKKGVIDTECQYYTYYF